MFKVLHVITRYYIAIYHFVANFILFQKIEAIFNDFACTRRYSRYKWRHLHIGT